MAKRSTKTARKGKGAEGPSYCASPEVPERTFDANVDVNRAALIRTTSSKWVNGTVLRYYFFDDTRNDGQWAFRSNGLRFWRTWATPKAAEKTVVRKAFKTWQDVGIGVKFEEVKSREDAEIRIGFMRGDGAWSYVGRGILTKGAHERTMNFGWDLTRRKSEIDTAVHELVIRWDFLTNTKIFMPGLYGMRKWCMQVWPNLPTGGVVRKPIIISFGKSSLMKCRDQIGTLIRSCIILLRLV